MADPIDKLIAWEASGGVIGPDDRALCEQLSGATIAGAVSLLGMLEQRGVSGKLVQELAVAVAFAELERRPAHRWAICRGPVCLARRVLLRRLRPQ